MGLFNWGKKDSAKATGSSTRSVSRAFHDARYNIFMNSIEKIAYIDAHYSYKDQETSPQGEMIFYGVIQTRTSDFIDLKIGWSTKTDKIYFGIVIPTGCIDLKERIDVTPHLNKMAGVYWNDIFVYDEDYSGPHVTRPMYTEGTLIKEDQKYIWIRNPETINFERQENYPLEEPLIYVIPKGMITQIKSYGK